MKTIQKFSLLLIGFIIISCNNDDEVPPFTQPVLDSVEYGLGERSNSGVSGDATFNELENGSVQLILEVTGTSTENMHPAHIHMNSSAEGGGIIVSLNPVDGSTGLSITEFTSLDDGTVISFEDISGLDAYINIHLSSDDLGTIVSQGDIGQNELTGESKSYVLEERDAPGISGTVLFEERISGEALATISLQNTPDGGEHPAHIHSGTAAVGGGILYTFKPVDGSTGMSQSHVATLDDESAFGYADILAVDGYVNVHLSSADLGTIVAQGNIGANE